MKATTPAIAQQAVITFEESGSGELHLRIIGRLDTDGIGQVWRVTKARLESGPIQCLRVEASGLTYCDGAGIAWLLWLRRTQETLGARFELTGLSAKNQRLFDLYNALPEAGVTAPRARRNFIHELGRLTLALGRDLRGQVVFTGELLVALALVFLNPRRFRWREFFVFLEKTGVNALPIVAMLGFLFGLILAFQSAVPLKYYGADLFVPNLVALSLLREMGPLITAIVLAGRSGSAFAAELGTMKINEEINALRTLGLDPVRFLVTARVLAAVVVMPFLTVFANLFGLAGAAIVMGSFGFPLVTFSNQVISAVRTGDLLGGLFKSLVFGLLVGAVGCLRGLQTGAGASAVGDSTTRAVVSAIVLLVITDGIFAIVFYHLGI